MSGCSASIHPTIIAHSILGEKKSDYIAHVKMNPWRRNEEIKELCEDMWNAKVGK